MPRHQRKKSNTGYYHAILRGNEQRNIFLDEKDKLQFIDTLFYKKQNDNFYIHAFCLMDNHVHLMVSEGREDISTFMKKIAVSYVFYFNNRYNRSGHLFQDRFRSETVEDDSYLISLARYIHRNPVKANIVKDPGEYKWSSYNAYIRENNYFRKLINTEAVLKMFSDHYQEAIDQFMKYTNMESNDVFLDLPKKEKMDEDKAKAILKSMLEEREIMDYSRIPNDLIAEFKEISGLSIRKIAQIIGYDKNKISRIIKAI